MSEEKEVAIFNMKFKINIKFLSAFNYREENMISKNW